ncbi:hypothetical protein C8Q74DRAFT_641274 [Fomes fomentarius]|nr:hypothetical protein C8Q74DRAFT_641274 [Fomes fomentarius]
MYKRLLALVSLVLSLTAVDSRVVRDVTTADLTVHVAAPNVARDAGDFLVNTTVTNIGMQTISLLKHSGVFRPHTKNFAIVDSFGNAAKFTGIKAKWSPRWRRRAMTPRSFSLQVISSLSATI